MGARRNRGREGEIDEWCAPGSSELYCGINSITTTSIVQIDTYNTRRREQRAASSEERGARRHQNAGIKKHKQPALSKYRSLAPRTLTSRLTWGRFLRRTRGGGDTGGISFALSILFILLERTAKNSDAIIQTKEDTNRRGQPKYDTTRRLMSPASPTSP